MRRCYRCMGELGEEPVCPYCGYDSRTGQNLPHTLQPGTILHGKYLIGNVLGQGGFGITYLGLDMILEVKVAIKEYFVSGSATRVGSTSQQVYWMNDPGDMNHFITEARRMARLDQMPEIAHVRDIFYDNQTAYIIMEYVEGQTLNKYLIQTGKMTYEQAVRLMLPVIEALGRVHEKGLIHRDISPDNLMVEPRGTLRVLDLGAAGDLNRNNGHASQLVARQGFSPYEQYMEGAAIGPATDVYAVCATIYYCCTGRLIPDAFQRMEKFMRTQSADIDFDPVIPPDGAAVLQKGMALDAVNRIGNMEALAEQLRKSLEAKKQPIIGRKPKPEEEQKPEPEPEPEPKPETKKEPKPEPQPEPEKEPKPEPEPKKKPKPEPKKPKPEPKPKPAREPGAANGKLPLIVGAAGVVLVAGAVLLLTGVGRQKEKNLSVPAVEPTEVREVLATTEAPTVLPTETQQPTWATEPATAPMTEPTTAPTEPPTEPTTAPTAPEELRILQNLNLRDADFGGAYPVEVLSGHDPGKINWSSSDPKIAPVSKDGTVTASGFGTVEITAEYRGQTAVCTVNLSLKANVTCTFENTPRGLTITGFEGDLPAKAVLPRDRYGTPVAAIGDAAFRSCKGLTDVMIQDGVKIIGGEAFAGCTSLKNITIPNTVTEVGGSAFLQTPWLAAQTGEFVVCGDGVLLKYNGSAANVTIPATVKAIGGSAFHQTRLTGVSIPESVTAIDSDAFAGSGLTRLTIPNTVTTLKERALAGCAGLTEVTLPENMKELPDGLFVGCTSLTKVNIPQGVTKLVGTFSGCTGLKTIVIPEGITEIGADAFSGCTGLRSVTLPKSLRQIGAGAFRGCTGLTELSLPDGLTGIGKDAFRNCAGVTKLNMPNSVKSIYEGAFLGCGKLRMVLLPGDCRFLGERPDNPNYTVTVEQTQVFPEGCQVVLNSFGGAVVGWSYNG